MPKEEEEDSLSKFNEAIFQMRRLDTEQARINISNQSPLELNQETGMYNYELMFNSMVNQFIEISPKLKTDEILKGKLLRKQLQKQLRTYPPYTTQRNALTHEQEEHFIKQNWEDFKELLFNFTLFIRKMMDVHHITTPKQGESSWF